MSGSAYGAGDAASWGGALWQQPAAKPFGGTAHACRPGSLLQTATPSANEISSFGFQGERNGYGLQLPRPMIVGMRRLEAALFAAREGTGEVRDILLSAGFHPRLPGLTKIISKLSKGRACVKALEVFEALYDLGLMPDTAITNAAISACDKGGLWQRALQIFNTMDVMGIQRDIITYCATISVISWSKRWELALEVFKHMQSNGVAPDAWVCSSFLGALERGGQWRLAEAFFLRMCRATGIRLAAYEQCGVPYLEPLLPPPADGSSPDLPPGRSSSLESACSTDTVWSGPNGCISTTPTSVLMVACPTPTPPVTCAPSHPPHSGGLQRTMAARENNLTALVADLSVCVSKEPPAAGPALSPEPAGTNSTPAPTTPAARSRNPMAIMETLLESPPSPPAEEPAGEVVPPTKLDVLATPVVEPNHVCCNVLLQAFARANPPEWVKALHLLEAMWEVGGNTQPDWVSYKIAIKACTSAKQFRAAMQVYDAMVRRGIEPSMQVLVTLMSAAGEEGDYEAITRMWARFEASGLVVNTSFMNAYLAALDMQGLWEEAERNFCTMLSPDCCVEPSVATFNIMMRCYIHQGTFDKARGIFNRMCSMGLRPRLETFNSLIAAYAQQGQWCGAVATLRNISSPEMGIKPDIIAFNTALSALANAATQPGQDLSAIASQAADIFQKMRAKMAGTPPPDGLTFTLLTSIFEGVGRWGECVNAYELMRSTGILPSQEILRILVAACIKGGLLKAGVNAVNEARQLGVQADHATCQALLTACCEMERQSGLLGLQRRASADMAPTTPRAASCAPSFPIPPASPTTPMHPGPNTPDISVNGFQTSAAGHHANALDAFAGAFANGGTRGALGNGCLAPAGSSGSAAADLLGLSRAYSMEAQAHHPSASPQGRMATE